MSDYLLTIIIPTYNCQDYIEEGLASVLKQLPENAELIVVDDGSEDRTKEILSAYENRQENLRVYYNEHSGASGTRNKGLELAQGEFVGFIDCDDCLRDGFLEKALPLTESAADLYIFEIEWHPLSGMNEIWSVDDRVYPDVSAFADEYIRVRKLMIYSNCNKFYRRSVIEKLNLRFEEQVAFGEDRLFNYKFLKGCGKVVTSSFIMLEYMQRSFSSQSGRTVPGYYDIIVNLHKEKMNCFLNLSKGTSWEEKRAFMAYDLSREIETMIARFAAHPKEKEENLPKLNRLVFEGPYDMDAPVDILVVAGSSNCGYKIQKAFEIGQKNEGVRYIVSGGNLHKSGTLSEAEFMAQYLKEQGVPEEAIYLENRAQYTLQNLVFSSGIVHRIRMEDAKKPGFTPKGVGIVTGGFHLPRTRRIREKTSSFEGENVCYFPAYGPNTGEETWYQNEYGKSVILGEVRKLIRMGYDLV